MLGAKLRATLINGDRQSHNLVVHITRHYRSHYAQATPTVVLEAPALS